MQQEAAQALAQVASRSPAAFLDIARVMFVTVGAFAVLGTRLPLGSPRWLIQMLGVLPFASGLWFGWRGHREDWRNYIGVGVTSGASASAFLISTLRDVDALVQMSPRDSAILALAAVVLFTSPVMMMAGGSAIGKMFEAALRASRPPEGVCVRAARALAHAITWRRFLQLCRVLPPLTPLIRALLATCLLLLALLAKF